MVDLVLDILNKVIDEKPVVIDHPKFKGSVTSTGKLAFTIEKDQVGDTYLRFSPDSTIRVTMDKFIMGFDITISVMYVRIVKGNKRAFVRGKKGPVVKDVEFNIDDFRAAFDAPKK